MTAATAGLRPLLDAQRTALTEAVGTARSRGRAVIAGATGEIEAADPIALFGAARARGLVAAAWIRPAEGSSLVGIGAALTFAARGTGRLAELRQHWRAVCSAGLVGSPPRAFVGTSFDERGRRDRGPRWDDFPAALLVLPRVLVERRGTRTVAHTFAVVGADAEVDAEIEALRDLLEACAAYAHTRTDRSERTGRGERAEDLPAPDRWRDAVAATRADVRVGRLEKAVLARAVRVHGSPDVEHALSLLATRFPSCTVFAVARGESCFLGATPESLVRLADGSAVLACVAGTAPRDDDPTRDSERARVLAASEKERSEHDIVVREARAALGPLCDDIEASEAPRPVPLANVWHLVSEVRGRARAGVDLLDLARALHPTPAVCGYPREQARRVLSEREPFDRGWYAGALGWIDAQGEGELAVALRCALVSQEESWLFAGCGIVAGSDPTAELAESDAKLRPMLEALGAA